MSKTTAKIYYLPIDGGRFKEVPTQEYVLQPEVRKRKKEDPITLILLVYIALIAFCVIVAQIGIRTEW